MFSHMKPIQSLRRQHPIVLEDDVKVGAQALAVVHLEVALRADGIPLLGRPVGLGGAAEVEELDPAVHRVSDQRGPLTQRAGLQQN